jgi:hypothetical protein
MLRGILGRHLTAIQRTRAPEVSFSTLRRRNSTAASRAARIVLKAQYWIPAVAAMTRRSRG